MLRTSLLLLFLISYTILFAQEGTVWVEVSIPPKSDFRKLRPELRNNDIDLVEKAFLRNDFDAFSPFLHPLLEKNEIKKYFESVRSKINGREWNLVTHYDEVMTTQPFGSGGNLNIIRISQVFGGREQDCDIDYTYYIKDSTLVINSLKIRNYALEMDKIVFPSALLRYEEMWYRLMNSKDSTYEHLVSLEKQFVPFFNSLKKYKYEFIEPDKFSHNMSHYYGQLSWYLLVRQDFEGALKAAKRGLKLSPAQEWINTNLALAYLLLNDFDSAREIYISFKDKEIPHNGLFKSAFLKDINDLEKEGIRHPDFEKVKSLMAEQ